MKVLEKAIKNKAESQRSQLFSTGKYQTGLKKGQSTAINLAQILNYILWTRTKRSEKKIIMALDIAQAYDSVNRKKLFEILDNKVKNDNEK